MAGLGRGLTSLLSESKKIQDEKNKEVIEQTTSSFNQETSENNNSVVLLPIEKLKPSIYQPRKNFDEESLEELSLSIKEHGLLEPLLVKKNDDLYEIICGERRYRACKLANIEKIPCLIRDDLELNGYAIALVENIQREDLNPLEMAQAFALVIDECKLSQEELAKTLGKSRSTITNILRLNNLQDDVKKMVIAKQIDLGHAKVLLSIDEADVQLKAALYVIKKGLSVRQTEELVKSIKDNGFDVEKSKTTSKSNENKDAFAELESKLSSKFNGIKFKVKASDENKGKITLSYTSKEQFEQILDFLQK